MTRLTFYGITLAALIGMIAGLLELIYQQVCDQDPTGREGIDYSLWSKAVKPASRAGFADSLDVDLLD